MKQTNPSEQASSKSGDKRPKKGKRPLLRPELGASNYRRLEEGRFTDHPAFKALRKLNGAAVALRIPSSVRKMERRLSAIARQMDEALRLLCDETEKLKGRSDKLRFAEAIASFFHPSLPDDKARRVLWRAIEMRRSRERPSQAELRRAVGKNDKVFLSEEPWKRLLKRSGLNKELPIHREKASRGRLA